MALIVRHNFLNLIVSKPDEPFRYVTLRKGQEVDLDKLTENSTDEKLKDRLESQLKRLKANGAVVDDDNGTLVDLARADLKAGAGESKPPGEENVQPEVPLTQTVAKQVVTPTQTESAESEK